MSRTVLYRTIPGAQLDDFIRQFRHATEQVLGKGVTSYFYFVDADRLVEARVDGQRVLDAIRDAVEGIEQQRFWMSACEEYGGSVCRLVPWRVTPTPGVQE